MTSELPDFARDLRLQVNANTCSAGLLRLLADVVDDRPDAEAALVLLNAHKGDGVAALKFLSSAEKQIKDQLLTLALTLALDLKERTSSTITKGDHS